MALDDYSWSKVMVLFDKQFTLVFQMSLRQCYFRCGSLLCDCMQCNARYFCRNSVCPSVCLPHAWIVTKLNDALRKNVHAWKEYLALAKGVQNFNFLSLVVSEIWGVSQIYTRGRFAPQAPSVKIFTPEKSTWPFLNVYKISTFYL